MSNLELYYKNLKPEVTMLNKFLELLAVNF